MDTKYLDGLYANNPHEKAPDFVIARLSIMPSKLIEALKNFPQEEYLRMQILKSKKDGKYYAQIDTYKSDNPKDEARATSTPKHAPQGQIDGNYEDIEYPAEDFNPADIPF